jgi:hypothetical protein
VSAAVAVIGASRAGRVVNRRRPISVVRVLSGSGTSLKPESGACGESRRESRQSEHFRCRSGDRLKYQELYGPIRMTSALASGWRCGSQCADLEVLLCAGHDFAVAGMIDCLHADDSSADRRLLLAEIFGELGLGAGGADDQDFLVLGVPGVRDRLSWPLQCFHLPPSSSTFPTSARPSTNGHGLA